MPEDKILCLSYFDQIIGPNLFYCSEPLQKTMDVPDLGKILEFNEEEGAFIFAFRKYQTINYVFNIKSKFARGGEELVMLSYMIRAAYFRNEIVDVFKYLESKTSILEQFSNELKNMNGFTSVLRAKKSAVNNQDMLEIGTQDFKSEFLTIFNKYYEKLTPRFEIESPLKSVHKLKKLFIFGARYAGKTTFLKNIETIQFHNQGNNDLPTRIYDVIIDNLEILTYDCIERNFKCDQCINFKKCSDAQAFIFIINLSDLNSIDESKNMLQIVLNKILSLDNDKTPLLIIGNKFQNDEVINPEFINENLRIEELRKKGIKIRYFPIDLIHDRAMIMKSLRWLVKQML